MPPNRLLIKTLPFPLVVSSRHLASRSFSQAYNTLGNNNSLQPSAHLHRSASTMTDNSVPRNPHPDFKAVEASRPEWDTSSKFRFTQTPDPNWKLGDGLNQLADDSNNATGSTCAEQKRHISINPYQEGRPSNANYKLLISGITPRPIGFLSTRSLDGKSTNLAPFSFFNMINYDPPLFVVGFTSGIESAKDTLRNLIDTKECVINVISESFVEAANSTSIDAPYGTSEWDISGLTPDYSCETVSCARVREAVFSVEAKLDMVKEWDSRAKPGTKSGTMAVLEGTHFWVREDATNEDRSLVDPAVSLQNQFEIHPLYNHIFKMTSNFLSCV